MNVAELRRRGRQLFHWKYSGAFIPLFFGIGFTLVEGTTVVLRFEMAYLAFALGGLLGLGYWLTSDSLAEIGATRNKREIKRDRKRLAYANRKYLIAEYLGIIAIVIVTAGFLWWTRLTELATIAEALKQQRDDVYDHLIVDPQPPQKFGIVHGIDVSIVNEAHADMDKHHLNCVIHGIINYKATAWVSGWMGSETVVDRDLLGGGRGETISCNLIMDLEPPIVCGDIAVTVNFSVAGQPKFPLQKTYQFYYDKFKGDTWVQKNVASKTDYCSTSFGRR